MSRSRRFFRPCLLLLCLHLSAAPVRAELGLFDTREEPSSPFTPIITPYTFSGPENAYSVDPIVDIDAGCRDLVQTFGTADWPTTEKWVTRLVEQLARAPYWARHHCLRKTALMLQKMKADDPLKLNTISLETPTDRVDRIAAIFASKLGGNDAFQKILDEFPYSGNDPAKQHHVYLDLPNGQRDFFVADPAFPALLFKEGRIYGRDGDRTALLMSFDETSGALEAGGYRATPAQMAQLDAFLKQSPSAAISPEQLRLRSLVRGSFLGKLGDSPDGRRLRQLVADLVDLRNRNLKNGVRSDDRRVLDSILNYMESDGVDPEYRRDFLWRLGAATQSRSTPEQMCRDVCGMFTEAGYRNWQLEADRNELHKLNVQSKEFAYASVQIRATLEAMTYCDRAAVTPIYNRLLRLWESTWAADRRDPVEAEPFNINAPYGRTFSLLFDRRYKSLGTIVTGNPDANRLKFESELVEDFSDPRFFKSTSGGSNLGTTTFHFAYNMMVLPRDHRISQNASKILDAFIETCSRVNGDPYGLPYTIRFETTVDLDKPVVREEWCRDGHSSHKDEGPAARATAVALARYMHADPENRERSKEYLEGALERFWNAIYVGKVNATRDDNESWHTKRRAWAPYFLWSSASAAAAAIQVLKRDFPADKDKYDHMAAAIRNQLHEMWEKVAPGKFGSWGTANDQFEQPLAALTMFGLGVCGGPDKPQSFGILDPSFARNAVVPHQVDGFPRENALPAGEEKAPAHTGQSLNFFQRIFRR